MRTEYLSLLLFSLQVAVVLAFGFFAFFNYLYAVLAIRKIEPLRVKPSDPVVAIVIVAFNEHFVLPRTILACEALTYANKVIVLADDSTDSGLVSELRSLAISKGCAHAEAAAGLRMLRYKDGRTEHVPVDIWESPGFIYFHRQRNAGFKPGALQQVFRYLSSRGIQTVYLLDSDWRPQTDAIERCLEVLESEDKIAFVQTKRLALETGMNLIQRYVALTEEGAYYVDHHGRQVAGHPILFTGCCSLLRLQAIEQVGGLTPGHLTEDLDLSDSLWVAGWKGVFLDTVSNWGEVPFSYEDFRRQQERWAAGSARALREQFWPIVRTPHLTVFQKLSALRQNVYYMGSVMNALTFALLFVTAVWLLFSRRSPATEYYLYLLQRSSPILPVFTYLCLLSNFAELFVMVLFKKKRYRDLIHLPIATWLAWGTTFTYAVATIKGFTGVYLDWFRTPKFLRGKVLRVSSSPAWWRVCNGGMATLLGLFYFLHGQGLGWFDPFALLWLPAFILVSLRHPTAI